MRASLKSRWFPSLIEEEARLEQEELERSRRHAVLVKWVNHPQFDLLVNFVEAQIIKNEPDETTTNPLFKNGTVKGLRIVEANLKAMRAKVQEIVNV